MFACCVDFGGLPDNLLFYSRNIYSRVVGLDDGRCVANLVEYHCQGVPYQFIEFKYNNGAREVFYLVKTILTTYESFLSALEYDGIEKVRVARGDYLVMSFAVGRNLIVSLDDLLDFAFGRDTDDNVINDCFGLTGGVIYG